MNDEGATLKEEGKENLRVNVAVAFIMMMRLDRLAGSTCNRVRARVFPSVLQLVQVLENTCSQPEECQRKNDRRRALRCRESSMLMG